MINRPFHSDFKKHSSMLSSFVRCICKEYFNNNMALHLLKRALLPGISESVHKNPLVSGRCVSEFLTKTFNYFIA